MKKKSEETEVMSIKEMLAWVWIGFSGLMAMLVGVFGSDSGNAAKWEIELVMMFMFILFSAPGWLVLRSTNNGKANKTIKNGSTINDSASKQKFASNGWLWILTVLLLSIFGWNLLSGLLFRLIQMR